MSQAPLPAVARLHSGEFCVLARHLPGDGTDGGQRVLIQESGRPPQIVDLDVFCQRCEPDLIYARPSRSTLMRGLLRSIGPVGGDGHVQTGIIWFLSAFLRNRGLLAHVFVLCVALQVLALLTPLFFQVLTDKVLVSHAQATLQVLIIGLMLAGVFETFFASVRSAALNRLSARVDVSVGQQVMRHLLSLPVSYFSARRAGDTLARIREAENIRSFMTGAGINAVLDVVFALLFIGMLFFYSEQLTLLVLASIVLYAAIALAFSPLLLQRVEHRFRAGADVQSFVAESIQGVLTLKSMSLVRDWIQQWDMLLARSALAMLRHSHALVLAQGGITLVNRIVQTGLLGLGAHAVMQNRLSVGELLAFNMLAMQVSGPVLRLSQLWGECQQLRVSLRRMNDIFSSAPEFSATTQSLAKLQGRIAFENVSFRYRPDRADVIANVSFVLKPGEVLGIVGQSGSGKSTLVQLLLGLHASSSGRVLVDEHDVSLIDRTDLRKQIGLVMQESVLFNRSIRENIAICMPTAPIEQIVAAARLAGAHDFIAALPQAYDTMVGEQGAGLSGGQRQRIAIARALLKNPRILIFDEATSALDVESEFAIHSRMQHICENRTVIVIAHRLSAVRHAHRIMVMQGGRIIEQGSRQSLLEKADGHFFRMYRLQLQGMA